MKRNVLSEIKNDLWVLVMDVIAVNAAYLLALLFRYYIHFTFVPFARQFLSVYIRFAPFYTVLCIAVFVLFRLYNGVWRCASLSDMNRIVGANAVTAVINVLGTLIFFQRMPLTYYAIGGAIQFIFIALIRFSYRIVEIEKQKLENRKSPALNVMVVGADVTGSRAIKYLEGDSAFRPVVVVDRNNPGKHLLGVPVVAEAAEAIDQYGVKCVFIADPLLPDRQRAELRRLCEARGIDLHDYTGFLQNQTGSLPLTDLMRLVSGKVSIQAGDRRFDSVEEALQKLNGRFTVTGISGEGLTIEIQPAGTQHTDEAWAKAYKEQTGEDVSFF